MKYTDVIQERHGKIRTDSFEIVDRRVRPMMLRLIFKNDTSISMSYARLQRCDLAEETLNLEFMGTSATIRGHNLSVIYNALCDHRVTFLRESKIPHHCEEKEVVIGKITIGDTAS